MKHHTNLFYWAARCSAALLFTAVVIVASGCRSGQSASPEKIVQTQDLAIVDCLLPGQIRRLGNTQYAAARRAIKTTQHDCAIRGGEYTAYDRADYASALQVWLPLASSGDATAQNYVGEIYEKGIGGQPDYTLAAHWYGLAAQQQNNRALMNLASLYEQGLGVERDLTRALDLYRQAYDIDEQSVLISADTQLALESELSRLKAELKHANKEHAELEASYLSARQKVSQLEADSHVLALRALYEKSLSERSRLQTELDSMSLAYRNFQSAELLAPANLDLGDPKMVSGVNFGRYYALIIGNQNYEYLEDLKSPLHDAKRLQSVLEQRYGFRTQLIENGSEKDVLFAINRLFNELGPEDNLLIFYAGHGELSSAGLSKKERGYWLPVDAHSNNISNWINNAVISDHLDRIKARSVLVISDSCFAGNLGADKSPLLFGLSDARMSADALKSGLNRRSRVVISSGGERPVLDGRDKQHSVFAGALIDILENNDQPLRDSQLFSLLSVNVSKRANDLAMYQQPEMKPVREAGHEGGNFFFVPQPLN